MIFRRLLESRTYARSSLVLVAEGYAVSVVAHAAAIGGMVYMTTVDAARTLPSDALSPVAFYIPKDRIAGSRPKQERITFMATANPGDDGSAADAPRTKVVPRAAPEPGPGVEELASNSAQTPTTPQEAGNDTVMTVLEVDEAAARYDDSAAPPYPPSMLEKRIEGTVAIQYVVDTSGRADTSSVVILSSTHDAFAKSVKGTLPQMHFRPATIGERKVRQLVQQLFSFKIDTTMLAQQGSGHKKPTP